MATLTSHTLVAGIYQPYFSYRGWNSPQQGLLTTSFGTLDGSVNNVNLSSSWGVSSLYLESIYENFDPGGRDLKVFFDGPSSTTTVWYDVRINGTQFRRVDASSSAGPTTYSRQYEWAGISSTLVENNTYSIIFTDDGQVNDSVPNQFDLGANVTNATVGSYVYRSFTLTGINVPVAVYADNSNTGVSLTGSSYGSVVTANNNDVIYVRGAAPSSYSTANTISVSCNGVSDTFTITTEAQVVNGVAIPLGISSGAIDLNTLRNFFGEPTWGSSVIGMSDLYKGGNLVPSVSANASIPTSGTIDLADFYGAQTYLEIEKNPPLKSVNIFSGGSGTAVLTWNMATDPNSQSDIDVGYKALKSVCEYRWVIDVTNQNGYLNIDRIIYNGQTVNNPSDPYTTAWSETPTLSMEVDYGVETGFIHGNVRFEVRKIWNGTTYTQTSNNAFWEVVVENAGE